MKTKLLLFNLLVLSQLAFAQEIFFKAGKNLTSYSYSSSAENQILKLKSKIGANYEIGYQENFKEKFSYQASVTLNQFNSFSTNEVQTYSWNTTYIGLKNGIGYVLFKNQKNLSVELKGAVNLATIIDGKEEINGVIYDIKKLPEFKGLFFQPSIGLDLKYPINDNCIVNLGYTFSNAFKFSHPTDEKLAFITNQIQFGLHFPL